MHVNLLDFTSGQRRVMAVIRIEDGQLVIEGRVPPDLQKELEVAKGKASTDDVFLRSLPRMYSGTYLRAQLEQTRVQKGGPGSGRYPKGSGGQHESGVAQAKVLEQRYQQGIRPPRDPEIMGEMGAEAGHVRLYRGDSQTLSPALGYSDPAALFGAGIYLTDSKRIAGDYRAKGNKDIIFRYGAGANGTKQDAIDAYIRQLASTVDEKGHELKWPEPINANVDNPSRLARLKQGAKLWAEIQKTTEVRKLGDGDIVFQTKGKTGHLSEYDIPSSWIAKTLDAEGEIPKQVAVVIHEIMRKTTPRLASDIYDKAMQEDESGFRPSFRDIYKEAAADSAFNGGALTELDGQLKMRAGLKELGYKGIRYTGGISMGGARHNAYVFWDEQGLKKQRQKWDFKAVLDKFVERVYALKGGPGSGRYPKGSGGHKVPPPPKDVLERMDVPDGGFTYRPTTGEQPTVGFALSIHRDREQVVDAKDANAVALAKYVVKNWDLLKLKGNYIGGWHNPDDGRVYLDVSTVVKTEHEAESMARAAHQLAYFDLVRGVSIKIVGDTHAKAAADTTSRGA